MHVWLAARRCSSCPALLRFVCEIASFVSTPPTRRSTALARSSDAAISRSSSPFHPATPVRLARASPVRFPSEPRSRPTSAPDSRPFPHPSSRAPIPLPVPLPLPFPKPTRCTRGRSAVAGIAVVALVRVRQADGDPMALAAVHARSVSRRFRWCLLVARRPAVAGRTLVAAERQAENRVRNSVGLGARTGIERDSRGRDERAWRGGRGMSCD